MGKVAVETVDRDDASIQRQAARLGASRRRLFLIGQVVGLAVPAAIWASGASEGVWSLLDSLPFWARVSAYLTAFWATVALAAAPLSYAGHRLQHEYGLSRQSAAGWAADWLKGTGLGIAFGTLASLAFFATARASEDGWWWRYGALMGGAGAVLTYVAPYVLLPLFFRPRPVEDPAVLDAIRALVERAGTRVQGVFRLDFSRRTNEANAAVIGVGRSRRVVLADTMLDEFPLAELRAVIAHELGHHVNRDVPKLLVFQFGTAMFGLYSAARGGKSLLRWVGGSGDLTRVADFPLLALGAELFGLLSLPIGNLFSRTLEAEADRYAHRLSGDPLAFAAAMERLARQNLAELSPPRWAEIVFASHPPMAKRIRAARELAGA